MTAPELSARERETLARIESTPAAPESFDATREKVARAMYDREHATCTFELCTYEGAADTYRRLADAAIDAMTGAAS